LQAVSKVDRQAVDAAAVVLVEEVSRLGITHAGFAMTSLPHRRIVFAYFGSVFPLLRYDNLASAVRKILHAIGAERRCDLWRSARFGDLPLEKRESLSDHDSP
jgi:hypothetical protein